MPVTAFAENLFRHRTLTRTVSYGTGLEGGLAIDGTRLPDQEVADLASAPDGCAIKVDVTYGEGQQAIMLTSQNPAYLQHPIVRIIRVTDGELVIENERFELLQSARGQGVGALALALQVRACLRANVVRLDAYAAGKYNAAMTGYYVWPKLGFDARVPRALWQKFGAESLAALNLDHGTPGWVSDLMATPEGERLWRLQGQGLIMSLAIEADQPAVRRLLAVLDQWSL